MKAWDEMAERERDAAIAEHVTKFDPELLMAFCVDFNGNPMGTREDWIPDYTTNAVAETSVLAVVKKWNESRQWRFIKAIAELLRVRDTDFTTFGTMHLVLLGNGDAPGLQVGMISRAAYETLRQESGQ